MSALPLPGGAGAVKLDKTVHRLDCIQASIGTAQAKAAGKKIDWARVKDLIRLEASRPRPLSCMAAALGRKQLEREGADFREDGEGASTDRQLWRVGGMEGWSATSLANDVRARFREPFVVCCFQRNSTQNPKARVRMVSTEQAGKRTGV